MRWSIAVVTLLVAASAEARTCLGRDAASDPRTPEAFKACQQRERGRFLERSKARTGLPATDEAPEAFDDKQRADAGVYFGRHELTGPADDEASRPPQHARRTAAAETASVPPAAAALAGRAGVSPDELQSLRAAMVEKSEGGKKGVTPELAAQLKAYLMQKQGSISPDMQALLDAAVKDGPNLTPETMQKLRDAGSSAPAPGQSPPGTN